MPWNESAPMNERVKFIARYLQNEDPFAALCEDAEISRKTGYKWVERYEEGGVRALVDHSRWGPRKLLAVLRRHDPGPCVARREHRGGHPAPASPRAPSPPSALQRAVRRAF